MSQPQPQSPPQSPASRPPQPGSQPAAIVQKGLHPLPAPVKGAVITVSDRCAAGEREDASGPLAVELLRAHDVIVEGVVVVPDGVGEYPAGSVGIIASVTAPFCADCDRTRITADGRLMTCLFSARETDLRGPMRAGASDDELIRIWAAATWRKPFAHGLDAPDPALGDFVRPARTMSAIGG